ncbi:MAG: 50S ribosomal protein L18 [Patescibacteria group bacterium]|nr:50S ribosomal protein L18 [Patescibacteria group bacterium]
MINRYKNLKTKRKIRTRASLTTNQKRPRLTVFRSNKYTSAQIIDDIKGVTLVNANSKNLDPKKKTKVELAKNIGETIAKKAKLKKINKVAFDRGSYKYHGRVKALAEAARKAGLKF